MNIKQIVDDYENLCKTVEYVLRTMAIVEGHAEESVQESYLIVSDDYQAIKFNHEGRFVTASLGDWAYEYYEIEFTAEIPYDLLGSKPLQDALKDKMQDVMYGRKIEAEKKKKSKIQSKIKKLEDELKELKGSE